MVLISGVGNTVVLLDARPLAQTVGDVVQGSRHPLIGILLSDGLLLSGKLLVPRLPVVLKHHEADDAKRSTLDKQVIGRSA